MDLPSHVPAEPSRLLNDVARIIASRRNLPELFHDLAECVHRLVDFSYLRGYPETLQQRRACIKQLPRDNEMQGNHFEKACSA